MCVFEIVKNDEAKFDFFLNGQKAFAGIPEAYLAETLCTKWGFCGDELRAILKDLNQQGIVRITL